MANFNKVVLVGNLTRDPELRFTPKGAAIAKISMAINREWKSESGEKKQEVTFVEIDAFGRQAETIVQYVKKGSPFMCEGRLKLDVWDDKATGQKRSRLGVILEGFQFLGSAKGESDSRPVAPKVGEPESKPSDSCPPEDDQPPF